MVGEAGQVLAQRRIGDDIVAFTALTALAQLADNVTEVDIAIESD